MELRPAFETLFALNDAMADVVVRSTQPALAAIKLAWWRERLEELDEGRVAQEPRLQAAARELLPRSIAGAELGALEESWALLLQPDRDQRTILESASHGAILFNLAARLLGISVTVSIEDAGRAFAASQLARLGLIDLAPLELERPKLRMIGRARPLTGLAALARRDLRHGGPPFEAEATPARAWTLVVHRLTGRIG